MEIREQDKPSVRWLWKTGLFFAVCVGGLFWESLLFGRVPVFRDVLSHYHPWHGLVKAFLCRSRFPFWDPYSFCGTPLWANPQVGVLYPLNVILWVLPFSVGLTLFLFLHDWIAGVGMAVLLRRWGCSTGACWAAGISFCFGGWAVTRMEFLPALSVGVWFPWCLLLVSWAMKSRRGFVWLSLCLAMQILGGHPQTLIMSWMGLLFLAPWLQLPGSRGRTLWVLSCSMGMACLLSSIQFLPSLELSLRSLRSRPLLPEEALWGSIAPREWIRFLFPHRFGGAIVGSFWGEQGQFWLGCGYAGTASVMALGSCVWIVFRSKGQRTKECGLCLLVLCGLAATSMDFWPGMHSFVSMVPWLLRFRWPARWLYWAGVGMPLILGCVLQRMERWQGRPISKTFFFLQLGLASVALWLGLRSLEAQRILWYAVDRENVRVALIEGVKWDAAKGTFLMVWCGILLGCRLRWRFSSSLYFLCLVLIDLFPFAFGLLFMGDPRLYWGSVDLREVKRPRILQTSGLQWWNNYLYGVRSEEIYFWARRFSVGNRHLWHGLASAGGDNPMIPLLSMRHVEATEARALSGSQREESWRQMGVATLYGISSAGDPRHGRAPEFPSQPLRSALQMGEPILQDVPCSLSHVTLLLDHGEHVELESEWIPNGYRIRLNGKNPGRILVRESWDPGWQVRADGRRLPVSKENSFMGVVLPHGSQEVIFIYRPPLFGTGLFLSLISLVLLAGLFLSERGKGSDFSRYGFCYWSRGMANRFRIRP